MSKHTRPVPAVRRLLAVCAHPYDATFALGGVIAAFADAGTSAHIVCLLDHAPGTLATTSIDELADEILDAGHDADALLTVAATAPGAHPDHVRTMRAAYRAAAKHGSALYAWTRSPHTPTPDHTRRREP